MTLGVRAQVAPGHGNGRAAGACRVAVIEGEVTEGKGFERVLGGGLKVGLEPVGDGWAVRVVPANGPRGAHDYAELATPPYRSVNPLLVTTDFGFRAQDAVGWNPRRFRYAGNAQTFAGMERVYGRLTAASVPGPGVETELAGLVGAAPEGTLEILDARLVPGSADQSAGAAVVASHFQTTAHQVDAAAGSTPLGRLEWMRFRLRMDLPRGSVAAPGVKTEARACAAP
jgi:hypothetical protein